MLNYLSAKEVAKKWNVSQRRVAVLCAENRIEGATRLGNMWVIPSAAQKPLDNRVKQNNPPLLKPFVKWAGGKTQLLPELEKVVSSSGREIKKYAEPMVGGGGFFFYMLAKYPSAQFYISDVNAELINAYKVIQQEVEQLIESLLDLQTHYLRLDDQGKKAFYYDIRKKYNTLPLRREADVQKASYFIFLNKTCFNGLYRVNRKNQFNVPMGAYKNPTVCNGENLRNLHKALQRVLIVCGDYENANDFIDKDTLVYFDPPYRPLSQSSSFTSYQAVTFNDSEQMRLANFAHTLSARGAKIMISNSDPKNVDEHDDFFDELYRHYTITRVQASRTINSNAQKRGNVNELIIYN